MEESIFKSVKKFLGYAENDAFDEPIMTDINTALNTLTQLGVGPEEGFEITSDEETWSDFLGDDAVMFNQVKSYVGFQVQLMFDPPSSSSHNESIKNKCSEIEWRISAHVTTQQKG